MRLEWIHLPRLTMMFDISTIKACLPCTYKNKSGDKHPRLCRLSTASESKTIGYYCPALKTAKQRCIPKNKPLPPKRRAQAHVQSKLPQPLLISDDGFGSSNKAHWWLPLRCYQVRSFLRRRRRLATYGRFCIFRCPTVSDLNQIATCQCNMCRKWTGCLFSTDMIVKKIQVGPALSSFETFTEFQSSPGTKRAFCSVCGSSLAWFTDDMPDELIIFVGTIDEMVLMGKVHEDTVRETEHGKEFKRGQGLSTELTDASNAGNLYWQNAIPGVTDHLAGPKFLQHFVGNAPVPESTA